MPLTAAEKIRASIADFITATEAMAKPELFFQLAAPESFWQQCVFRRPKTIAGLKLFMRKIQITFALAALACAVSTALAADTTNAFLPVNISIDAAKPIGDVKPIWRFFGADEPNYAYMPDGKKLLAELGQLGEPQVYFRAHHMLTSGDGAYALKWGSTSAYKEDVNGNPIYDWTINDKIFDTYLARGIKPYVQLGFMPEALSTHPQNYPQHPPVNQKADPAGGQSYPPKDYVKWGNLACEWTKHCVEKYGADEVNKWYWEVWNEPNIMYWHGTHEDFSSSTITRLKACAARCRPRVWADQKRRAARAENFCTNFCSTVRTAQIMSPAKSVRRWTSFRSTQKARRCLRTITFAWRCPASCAT